VSTRDPEAHDWQRDLEPMTDESSERAGAASKSALGGFKAAGGHGGVRVEKGWGSEGGRMGAGKRGAVVGCVTEIAARSE
jgi:hypothetical protein